MNGNTSLSIPHLRDLLTSFWGEALEIESTPRGLLFTMPVSYPDGWQIVLELCGKTPKAFYLNDRGRTLGWLMGRGQNIETDAMKDHIRRLCTEHFMEVENGVLYRWLETPLDAIDLQVFAEGLAAVARLGILNDHRAAEENVADDTVQRIFQDAQIPVKRKQRLNITQERTVAVDYFAELRRPVALQIVRSKTDFSGTMEKWGFRWHELKNNYPRLAPIMVYDRDTQIIDPYSRHIGETECELFCGYDETNRIHAALKELR